MNSTPDPSRAHLPQVLVVEDSPVQAFSLVHMLERENLGVLCAPNGDTGLAMARQYMPQLIILDIQMPGMNGLELCRALKNDPQTAPIPIIFLTGHLKPEVFAETLQGSALDFIPKDAFSDLVLVETLRQLGVIRSTD